MVYISMDKYIYIIYYPIIHISMIPTGIKRRWRFALFSLAALEVPVAIELGGAPRYGGKAGRVAQGTIFSKKKYEKNGDFQEILRGFSRGFLREFLESTIYKYLQHLDVFFDVLFREFFWCFLGMFRLRLFFWWLFLMIFDEGEFRWCWMMLDDVLEN